MQGVDFSKSNDWNGKNSFGGKSLHELNPNGELNPYQEAIIAVASSMKDLIDSGVIRAFGFGDIRSQDRYLISLNPKDRDGKCNGLEDVMQKYKSILPTLTLAGPTSFAPIIRKAIEICLITQSYQILLLLADGQITSEKETAEALVEASKVPLSIIMVGIGDGPWQLMNEFDDRLPDREFDNFNFVTFSEIRKEFSAAAFALAALMEIPEQFRYIKANMLTHGHYKKLPIRPVTVLGPEFLSKSLKKKRKTQLMKFEGITTLSGNQMISSDQEIE